MSFNNITVSYKVLPLPTVLSSLSPAARWLGPDTRSRWSSSRCISWWTRSSPPHTRPPPGGELSPALNISREFLSSLIHLHKGDNLVLISGAAFSELCQPDLLPVPQNISSLWSSTNESAVMKELDQWEPWPVIEHLQSVHHLVSITTVVVGSQVVYPAAQSLTGLATKENGKYFSFLFIFTSKKGSNQLVLPEAGAGLTRVWKYFRDER